MYLLVLLSYLLPSTFALSPQNHIGLTSHVSKLTPEHWSTEYAPKRENAITNARNIFNTIHSAKRQWGSSVQHNGMSFIPATVPEGTLLYHGDPDREHVKGMEWLAFEIQHAEMFAAPRPPRVPRSPGEKASAEEPLESHREMVRNHMLLGDPRGDFPDPRTFVPGYLHIYQANRPLKLLYLDGMAAANCDRGTYDSQVYVLLENKTTWRDEFENACSLCEMGAEWGVDGFIRMEIGFEIIYCEFQDGLDLVSSYQTPHHGDPEDLNGSTIFETVRETAQRYQGIDSGRLRLEYTIMISAYFYPVNLTNPIPGNEDPRLLFTSTAQLARIKSDLAAEITALHPGHITDWQGQVIDMITARYSDRLKFLATGPEHEQFLGILNNMLNTYVDYNGTATRTQTIEKCAHHYLLPVTPRTMQDTYIHAAVATVMTRICTTLYQARDILIDELDLNLEAEPPSTTPQQLVQELNKWLDWPDWKFCRKCEENEVCYIAMFPFGSVDDHFFPRCKNESEIRQPSRDSSLPGGARNYWWSGWDPRKDRDPPCEPEPDKPDETKEYL